MRQDCMDNTDEEDCPAGIDDVCTINWISCGNQQYINLAKRCEPSAPVFRRQSHSIAQPVCANFVIPKFWLTTL
uniref:Sortilin_C domain-containing protein n=1 Tax=Macrostomum lignano TaxID=282301 RepID=A0A1I8JQ73_9PLAT